MSNESCSICGMQLNEESLNACINCGENVCSDDFDDTTGCCINCCDTSPFCGC